MDEPRPDRGHAVDPPTTALDELTTRLSVTPPGPPARPGFDFQPPPSAALAEMPRPAYLTVSSLLWFAAGGALLVAMVLPLVGVGDMWGATAELVRTQFPAESAETQNRTAATAAAALVGGGVLLGPLAAAAAATMRAGRRAGRSWLVVVMLLAVIHALLSVTVLPLVSAVLLSAAVTAAVAAGLLMFFPGTTDWLNRRRAGWAEYAGGAPD